jgi:eukaryotic-like serine/threonine-protein kinase
VKGWSNLQSLDWAADGKGFFVGNSLPEGYALLHVDLKGDAQVLLQQPGGVETFARPSRDGRHLAIEAGTADGNVWTMENF